MTFKEEMKERTEVIEKLLVKYLPKAEGYQSQIMEAKQILNQRHMERLQELTEILKEMALAGVPLAAIQDCVNKAYAPKKEETS